MPVTVVVVRSDVLLGAVVVVVISFRQKMNTKHLNK